MHKRPHHLVLILAVVVGLIVGLVLPEFPIPLLSRAQEQANPASENKILVRGHGVALSAQKPPGENFIFYVPNSSFRVVPPGKTFMLTDMFFNTRGVKQNLTVNLAEAHISTAKPNSPPKADILLQMNFQPGESKETHLCTGYAIASGHAVTAWTNYGLEPDQTVQIVVTGYLIEEVK
jgi:hypothetical protein